MLELYHAIVTLMDRNRLSASRLAVNVNADQILLEECVRRVELATSDSPIVNHAIVQVQQFAKNKLVLVFVHRE
jgi:hypothetical protein